MTGVPRKTEISKFGASALLEHAPHVQNYHHVARRALIKPSKHGLQGSFLAKYIETELN